MPRSASCRRRVCGGQFWPQPTFSRLSQPCDPSGRDNRTATVGRPILAAADSQPQTGAGLIQVQGRRGCAPLVKPAVTEHRVAPAPSCSSTATLSDPTAESSQLAKISVVGQVGNLRRGRRHRHAPSRREFGPTSATPWGRHSCLQPPLEAAINAPLGAPARTTRPYQSLIFSPQSIPPTRRPEVPR